MIKRGQTLVKLYCVSSWFELGLSVVDLVRGPSHFPTLHPLLLRWWRPAPQQTGSHFPEPIALQYSLPNSAHSFSRASHPPIYADSSVSRLGSGSRCSSKSARTMH